MTRCRNFVRGFYDYAETVSAESMTTLKLFSPSLWLCWNCVLIVYDSLQKLCPRSLWLRWNCVCRDYDYAETVSAESMTMLKLCWWSLWLYRNCFREVYDYAELCPQSLWLRWIWVCGVYDHAEAMFSPRRLRLRRNCVCGVYDSAETAVPESMTLQKLSAESMT